MSAASFRSTLASAITLLACVSARAQDPPPSPQIDLIVSAGRTLRIALDDRVTVRHVGQTIVGTLVDPVYAYDRVVLPAGARVRGHIDSLNPPSKLARARAAANGDFSPNHGVVLVFDVVALADGREVPIRTRVSGAAERVTLSLAAASRADDVADEDQRSLIGQGRDQIVAAREEATRRARDVLAAIKQPGKMERAKIALINRLPYHPQYLSKGMVYVAELLAPLEFGTATGTPMAPPGSLPAPESILSARLVTPLDSANSSRGAPIEAVLTEPVFSADHQLVLPEGSQLVGEVTFSTGARHFHRNGRLRFLFESVRRPEQDTARLLASLYSVQVSDANAVDLDEEGGARATESNARFIAPALAILALRASTHREGRRMDNDADDALEPRPAGGPAIFGLGGFFGWGLAGAAVAQIARPVGVALAAVGVARTVYASVFGKGRNVAFPADTVLQVQLAPAPAHRP